MVETLDHNAYNPANLIEFKVAFNLPYAPSNIEFERYDGTVEINGTTYSYVERKIENDTLVLHCLPNKTSDNIKLAGNEYGTVVNDLQTQQKGSKSSNASLLLKSLECTGYRTHNALEFNRLFFAKQLAAFKNINEKIVDNRFAKSPEQPPDAIA